MSEQFLLLRRPASASAPDDAQTLSKRERSSSSGEKRKSSKSKKSSSSSSSQSAPKSILKNSDPNASYHKQQRATANIEELLQSELPRSASSSSSSRRRHHLTSDMDGDDGGAFVAERNARNALQESDANNRSAPSGHHRASDSRRADRNRKGVTTETGVALYDQPKVSGRDRSAATGSSSDRRRRAAQGDAADHAQSQALYENFDFGRSRSSAAVYDVPRTTLKNNRDHESEAIYQNERLDLSGNGNADAPSPYDVPRIKSASLSVGSTYDVPKPRDGLSTIAEEQQHDYDVPPARTLVQATNPRFDLDDDDLIYENHTAVASARRADHASDRSSSGYRSSSSPSVQSEELYANEPAFAPVENLAIHRWADVMATDAHELVDLQQDKERKKRKGKKSHKEAPPELLREQERERERARAEEIEREIRRRKEDRSKHEKPKSYNFSKRDVADDEDGGLGRSEEPSAQRAQQQQPKPQQKDRSVDVYHETVRQRVTRGDNSAPSARDVFAAEAARTEKEAPEVAKADSDSLDGIVHKKRRSKGVMATQLSQGNRDQAEDSPSVRELLSKFEKNSPSKIKIALERTKSRDEESSALKMPPLVNTGLPQQRIVESLPDTTDNDYSTFEVAPSASQRIAFEASSNNRHDGSTKPNQRFNSRSSSSSEAGAITILGREELEADDPVPRAKSLKKTQLEPTESRKSSSSSSGSGPHRESLVAPASSPVSNMVDLVSRLYQIARVPRPDAAAEAAHMKGTLERLPQGKKKSTLWKSWKKQFFVADRGFLQIFSDESCAVLLEKIELFGGKLEVVDDCTLMVCDRKENVLMLKCSDQDSLSEWSQALEANVSQDFSRSFVLPSPSNLHLNMFTNVLIIDFGGASVRAGVGSHAVSMPSLFFPSVVAVDCSNDHERYFGIDAFEESVRKRCRLTTPMVPSDKVDKLSVDLITLQGICEKIFKELSIDPAHYEIQLSVPRPLSAQAKTAIANMFFEEFGVASLNMGHQTVFAFYAYNARSGVMVDLGERIDVVPIVEGYRVQSGTSRLPTGGKDLRSKLQQCLLGRNYSLTSFADDFITRYVVESAAYVALNAESELDKYRSSPDEMGHSLRVFDDPSGDSVADHTPLCRMTLGAERFEACEGLFKPELWGQDHAGVHVLVHKAIRECSLDVRKELAQSIFLAGGLSLLPGFRERLEAEMARLSTVRPRVHASPYRQHAAYLGASVHASTDAYHRTKVLKQDWAAAGAKISSLWAL